MTRNAPTSRAARRLTDVLDPEFVARLDALDVVSRKILQGKLQGERRSKKRGQSVEFADHRPYVVGDDLRFIDWNIFGRLEQLFLKLFLEEQDLTVNVLFDVSRSMGEGEPPKSAVVGKLAAALGYISLVNNNRLTLAAFAGGLVGRLANVRGRRYVPHMVEFILDREPDGESDFDRACRELTAARRGSGIVIVISDFLFKGGFEDGLRRLIGRNYDLYVLQVLSPQEIDPPMDGDLRLVDVEDGDEAEVTISAALMKFYKRNLAAWCGDLERFCTRRGAIYARTDSSQPVESLVLSHLRRRGLLK